MPKVFGKKNVKAASPKFPGLSGLKYFLESLRDIPWLPLAAIGSILGALLLWFYFQSIDYFPSDLAALIGLGLATAVSALGLYVGFAFSLLAPALMYRQYRQDDKTLGQARERAFSWWELLFLQLGSVALLAGFLAYQDYRDCGRLLTAYSLIALPCAFMFLLAIIPILMAQGTLFQRTERLITGAAIACFSAVGAMLLIPLVPILKTPYVDLSVGFFVLWALAMGCNALLAERLPVYGLALVGGLVVLISFIALPAIVAKPSFFPQLVATAMGVRHERVETFRVPSKTCQLMQSALGNLRSTAVNCSTGEWNAVRMQILSNVGEQWFVEVQTDATPGSAAGALRMSIPKAEVYLVQSAQDRQATQTAKVCGS